MCHASGSFLCPFQLAISGIFTYGDDSIISAVPDAARIHHPQAVLQPLTVGNVGVPEQQNVSITLAGGCDGCTIPAFYMPDVAVGHQNAYTTVGDQLLQGRKYKAIAVAGNACYGQFGVFLTQQAGILFQIAQMDDIVGLFRLYGIAHTLQGSMGVGKNQKLHKVTSVCTRHILD